MKLSHIIVLALCLHTPLYGIEATYSFTVDHLPAPTVDNLNTVIDKLTRSSMGVLATGFGFSLIRMGLKNALGTDKSAEKQDLSIATNHNKYAMAKNMLLTGSGFAMVAYGIHLAFKK